MPGFDGTGPIGQGAKTGRGLGRCTGFGGGLASRRGFGLAGGFGRGRGFRLGRCRLGRGYGYGPASMSTEDEKNLISYRINALENQLQYLRKRLDEING